MRDTAARQTRRSRMRKTLTSVLLMLASVSPASGQVDDVPAMIKRTWLSNQTALWKTPHLVEYSVTIQEGRMEAVAPTSEPSERIRLKIYDVDGTEPAVE